MTLTEFLQLKIGDRVYDPCPDAILEVVEIDRDAPLGGAITLDEDLNIIVYADSAGELTLISTQAHRSGGPQHPA